MPVWMNSKGKILTIVLIIGLILVFTFNLYSFNNQNKTAEENFQPEVLADQALNSYYAGINSQALNLYIRLINGYSRQGKPFKAIGYLPHLLAIAPKTENVDEAEDMAENLLKLYLKKERIKGLEDEPEKLKIVASALKEYSIYHTLYGNPERGRQLLSYQLKYLPDASKDWEIYFYLALALEKQIKEDPGRDKFLEIEKSLKKVIELNSDLAIAYRKLGNLYQKQGKLQSAREYLLKSLQIDPGQVEIYRYLGDLACQMGDKINAYRYYKKGSSFFSNDEYLQKKLLELKPFVLQPETEKEEKVEEKKPRFTTKLRQFVKYRDLKDSPLIRVGIAKNTREIVFKSLTPFEVTDENGKVLFQQGLPRQVWFLRQEKNRIILTNEVIHREFQAPNKLKINGAGEPSFLIFNLAQGEGYFWGRNEDCQFRGNLEVLIKPQGLTLVNLVHLEEYLLSVVPGEMPALWPEEALKAQAVSARSYTLANLKKHNSEGFDLCSGVHCAAYRGIFWEHPRSSQAVLATKGEVMYFGDKIVNAVFTSNSGGHSENSEDVWQSRVGYLRGVSTMKEGPSKLTLSPFELKEWLKNRPDSYSETVKIASPANFRWVRYFTAAELENRLGVGKIIDIIPLKRSTGGSVISLNVIGTKGNKIFEKGRIRSLFFGLRSNKFIIESIGLPGQEKEAFIFYGGGWGHGVGMDQTAAAGMARDGYSYQEILKRFYSDVEIRSVLVDN